MGAYTTRTITAEDYRTLIKIVRSGFTDKKGIKHRPNDEIATILVLEGNLGCRIGDIVNLTTDSFILDGGIWKLNIREEKTGKPRQFIVPHEIKAFLDAYAARKGISKGKYFRADKQAVWRILRAVTAYMGLKDISSHSIRKMAASKLYEQSGYDIEVVREFLNHYSTQTTQRYIKRSPKQLESAISKITDIA